MRKRKSEKKAFLLFKDRCDKLGYQFFVDTDTQYPRVCFWHKGLTKEQCLEQGCVRTVANICDLWMYTYEFLKRAL